MVDILPGAEAWSAPGGPTGVLVLHGFTGNPTSMRGLAEACAAAGHTVELPRLPGHGTTVEDMATTTWADWSAEVEAALHRLRAQCDHVVVAGLSMGGTLTAWLGTRHADLAGLVFINAATEPSEEMAAMVGQMVEAGETVMDAIGSDVADPEVEEVAYDQTPLVPLRSLLDAVVAMQDDLAQVTTPALIMHSPQDHVVAPTNAEHLAGVLSGPVERVVLERSYHVATIDFDRHLIAEHLLAFTDRVTSGA